MGYWLMGRVWVLFLVAVFMSGCASPAPGATAPATLAPTVPAATTAVVSWSPTSYVTWIIPHNPGGSYDMYSRAIAPVMSKYLGQDIVLKNVAGADGLVGAMQLYREKPDGYTIGIIDVETRLNESLLKKMDYDFNKFVWIGGIDRYRNGLSVAAKSPWKTVEDVRKAGTQKPIRIACSDVGVPEALTPKILNINATYVTGFGGSADAMVGVVKGDADAVTYSDASVLPYLKSGDLKCLLWFGTQQSEQFKLNGINVPLATEYPDLNGIVALRAIAAPPGTPANVASALEAALIKTLKDQVLLDWSKKTGNTLSAIASKDLPDDFKAQTATTTKWKEVLEKFFE